MNEDVTRPSVFVAPLTIPRSAPQRTVEDRYSLIPQFRLEPTDPVSPEAQAQNDLSDLAARVSTLETMINGATISAVCNGDRTITVTLTWGA